MTKAQYIERITQLLERCNCENILYYIMRFLEKMEGGEAA